MLRGTRRPGFATNNPLNSPIVAHTNGKPQHVSRDEMLQFLEKFISEKETLSGDQALGTDAASSDISLSSALSQLKRVQRDFQGLPPSAMEEGGEPSVENKTTEVRSAAGGTKMTFNE
ncbi:hypothetical protein ZYGM_001429 [Zygosaccharomyces mellis]|uniref:Uncharacterized protein n=1 Tax=Zygosaccharomyces mellis TaxID=42258 RepID=A0A4C2E9K2_9SACH|nr:hypothetical protein ZYGM_001429 [Zygosaccharomyces mellis]